MIFHRNTLGGFLVGYLEIEGGRPVSGQVTVQGSKNAALPILSAALLHSGVTVLHRCPRICDVETMLEILQEIGCLIKWEKDTLILDTRELHSCRVSRVHAGKMRSSITLLGSLLGRMGRAEIPYPGGCCIGARPVDLHLKGLEALGARVDREQEVLKAYCRKMQGTRITLSFPSVGATENLILAAAAACGETFIQGAAREPEVAELCAFLKSMGARIEGEGTSRIRIRGAAKLHDTEYTVCSDRIVAGTYLLTAAACGGEAELKRVPLQHMNSVLTVLRQLGTEVTCREDRVRIRGPKRVRAIPFTETAPFPGFPTDLQSPLMAVLCGADGISFLREKIFEARFQTAEELRRLGASIWTEGDTALILGTDRLRGADLEARELRGCAALCIAAAQAEGKSRVFGCEYIFRGYENVIGDLKNLGIMICCNEEEGKHAIQKP